MRDPISSGIGSLLSVMASHVRRCTKSGADAPHHFMPPAPGPRSTTISLVGVPPGPSPDRTSIFFDDRNSSLATQPRQVPVLGLAHQNDPSRTPQGRVQILVKSGQSVDRASRGRYV